ncbi:glutamine amidotransferase [Thiothrix fructosivorans]|uniref:Glutamine amidotransferase n=1 Tax=Thiothrix fructosivorans TaxID=111770 RepID=A0A8B0SP29_9GAMM|nr:glutamine amidotransferase [Thiothrix fructosivorans]MBO0611478.1 glutamine amidotransferase [Thiothrix fructosivorans]QTX12965.1 glutamine amidotransferase [Thiothrix fructosivorans]
MPHKTVVAIRHVAFEDMGTLQPVLEQRGYSLRYCDVGVDSLTALHNVQIGLLVVLGAPIGAYDDALYPFLADEMALITERLRQGLPTLGICLGAQLMARALGARVAPMPAKEIGFAPLTLTAAGSESTLQYLPADLPVLHWHGDQFEIPAGLAALAQTPLCPHQAFSVGNHALALQFHLEADARRIEQWLIGHCAELLNAGVDLSSLRQQAVEYGAALCQAGEAVIGAWLDELELGQGA